MALDISVLTATDLNHASEIKPIFDAAGNAYPDVSISVVSVDSERFTAFQRKSQQARLDKMARAGQLRLTAEEVAKEQIDLLVECTVAWKGFENKGEPLTCTADNVRTVYTAAPWIREQVNVFIGDRRNFFSISQNGSAQA